MKFVLLISFVLLLLAENNLCKAEEVADLVEGDDDFEEQNDDKEVITKEVDLTDDDDAKTESIEIGTATQQDIILRIITKGTRGGITYTKFGKRSCPGRARLVYEGYAGGGWYNQKGNGVNYLCLPHNPQYSSAAHPLHPSLLYGAEYETGNKVFSGTTQNYNVPCAVCYRPRKSSKIMIPARLECPASWSQEYSGYLMTSHVNHHHTTTYECVDSSPDLIPGSQRDTNGALFYFVQVQCNHGLPCGGNQYITRRAVTCVVCTK